MSLLVCSSVVIKVVDFCFLLVGRGGNSVSLVKSIVLGMERCLRHGLVYRFGLLLDTLELSYSIKSILRS